MRLYMSIKLDEWDKLCEVLNIDINTGDYTVHYTHIQENASIAYLTDAEADERLNWAHNRAMGKYGPWDLPEAHHRRFGDYIPWVYSKH